MIEKVLFLTRDLAFGKKVQGALIRAEVDIADVIDQEQAIPRSLGRRYNMLIVDKCLCGNASFTAKFILELRHTFGWPIIGVELHAGDGFTSILEIVGCTRILALDGLGEEEACEQIVQEVLELSEELDAALRELKISAL